MRDKDIKASVGMVDAVALMCMVLTLAIVALFVMVEYHSHKPSPCVCVEQPVQPAVKSQRLFPDGAKGSLK